MQRNEKAEEIEIAAAGYMTEADTEGLWNMAIDTARFTLINVRVGELLNFKIHGDAATDITDTAVLPILEQISEQTLVQIVGSSQITGVVIPYEWIAANVTDIAMSVINRNWRLLREIQEVLGYRKMEMTSCNLPDTNSRTY